MKQIITIFRAEGPQAKRLTALCQRTPRAQLGRLRDIWREDIRATSRLSGYVEYMDGWSMGDDFKTIIGSTSTKRGMVNGEMFVLRVTGDALAHLRAQTRRKHQFREQAALSRQLAFLAEGSGACEQPIALAIFREVVGGSMTDEELKRGSNHALHATSEPAPGAASSSHEG
jgi:hypothetical protein